MENGSSDQPSAPSNWQFTPDGTRPPTDVPQQSSALPATVSWTASEFIAHQKSLGWYASLAGMAIVAAGLIYLLTRDLITASMILIAAAALGAFAARKPRILQYVVDDTGIHIGSKTYQYGNYKAFSIVDEGPISSISLSPLKRFMPPLSMYYDPKDEDRIAEALNAYLPFEDKNSDMIDNFMRRIRF